MTEARRDKLLCVRVNTDFPRALGLTAGRNCRVTYEILYIPISANEIVTDQCFVSHLSRYQSLGVSRADVY